MAVYQLGEEQFNYFKACANELLNHLGMTDWDIDFRFEELDDARAQCATNWRARFAVLTLNSVWNDEPTEDAIKTSARHEALELLLDDIDYAYSVKSLSEDDKLDAVARARHAVIHRLLKALK